MSEVTLAVYNPPGPGLPFLGVAILPSGNVHVEPYETAEMAQAYLDRATKALEAFAVRGPKGEKRPADVIGAAVMVGKIATGEIADKAESGANQGKDPAAVSLQT